MTRPFNVLHTVRSLRLDGVTKVVLRNVAHRRSSDFRHHVCSILAGDADGANALADECRAAGVEPVFVDHRGVASAPRSVARIVRLIRRERIDIIHCNRTLDLTLAGAAGRICGVPVVNTLHWLGRTSDHPEDGDPSSFRRRAEMHMPALLNRLLSDHIIAVSGAVRESFASLPGFPTDRVTVTYPGQDVSPPESPGETRKRVRAFLGIRPDRPVVLNVGRLHPVKGQEHLVPMMQRVRSRVPDALLLIAGEGELRDTLRQRIAAEGLVDAVWMLGARDDVDALLAASDVLVLASESEAAPLPLFEAMRAAKPVVATQVGGVPEIVASGQSGFVVPRADPSAMADAVITLLAAPERAVEMGATGYRLLVERFDIDRAVESLEMLYRSVLAAHRSNDPRAA